MTRASDIDINGDPCPICGIRISRDDFGIVRHMGAHGLRFGIADPWIRYICPCGHVAASSIDMVAHFNAVGDLAHHFAEARLRPTE